MPWLEEIALAATVAAGAIVIKTSHGETSVIKNSRENARDEGCFAQIIIAESHVMINVFPEVKAVSLEVFTCGNTINPIKIIEELAQLIKHTFASKTMEYSRGTLGDGKTDIHHKPPVHF